MPIIKLTESDKLLATIVEDGWYQVIVRKFNDLQASKTQKSLNMFVELEIAEGKYAGKEYTICLNTETNNASVLGTMQFFPMAYLLNIAAAIENKPLAEVSTEVDTDNLVDRPFDAQIVKTVENGNVMNVFRNFLPKGKGAVAAAVPF